MEILRAAMRPRRDARSARRACQDSARRSPAVTLAFWSGNPWAQGSSPPGNEGAVAETRLRLAVAQGSAIAADHAPPGGYQHSLTSSRVPLHGRCEAGVDVGISPRNDAELERRPRTRARRHPQAIQHGLRLRIEMR